MAVRELTTHDLMRVMFGQLDLLAHKKITPAKASAAARLGQVIIGAANIEVQHHRMKPARGNIVHPVSLVREERVVPMLEDKSKKRRRK
jgi:hypothetical protein